MVSLRLCAWIALAPFAVVGLRAQTASITGRVTDSTAAIIPTVEIVAESVETRVKATATTNEDGYYTLPLLPPGKYNLSATKAGFKPIRQTDLELRVQQVARVDLVMEVGTLTESVEVSARAVLLDGETSTLGQVVQARQVAELPLLGRNPYALAMLVNGVRPASGVNDVPVNQINTASTSINGQRGNANEYLLDGAPNSAPSQNQPVIFPSVDSVQEFKIETNAFSAEYGRAAGGIFNVVTKSGTNEVHFTAYDFLRNDAFNANNWFANRSGQPAPPFKMNQFGGAVGGPLVLPRVYNGKNRTFFFGSIELVRLTQGVTYSNTVPQADQLAGDFSQTFNASGALVQVYDPLSTRSAGGTAFVRDLFPGNRIPANRMDPVAVAMSKYWPTPTSAGNRFTGTNNYVHTGGDQTRKDTFGIRFDHHFTERNRVFTRANYDDSPILRNAQFGAGNPASPQSGPQDFGRRNAILEDSWTINPSTLAIFRYSFTRLSNFRTVFSDGFDIKRLGFPAALDAELRQLGAPLAFPISNVAGEATLGNTSLIRLGNDIHSWQAQFLKTAGAHSIKSGAEYRIIKFNNTQTDGVGPTFSFTNAWTQGPDPTRSTATAGNALATFLLGVAGGTVNPLPAVAQQSTYYAGFFQDDWKVSSTLTLNLGVRYEYESPRTDRFNQLTNFNSTVKPPVNAPGLDLHGALTFVGVNGASRFQTEPDRNNFSPRLGFAWKAIQKMVIRGGGGLFYAGNTGVGTGAGAFGITGFDAVSSVVTSLDGVTPIAFLRNPFPSGLVHPSGSSLGAATQLGQSVSFFDRGNRTPYAEQWNLNLQRELPRQFLLDIGYAGSHGLKFPQARTLNQLPDSALALGAGLRTLVANPFYGQIATGILAQPTVSRAQLLRPYPQFDGVSAQNSDWASSIYHALQFKMEKRYSRGLTLVATYTYSKMIDYATGTWNGETLGGGGIQNWNYIRADRSVAELDQTHRFVFNGVYEIPLGKSLHGPAGAAIKGWQIGAIGSVFSGGPLGTAAAVNNTFSQGGGQRPNWSGISPELANPTPDHWFDTSQFTSPAPYTFGNAGRTLSGNRADTTKEVDISFSKTTRIREKLEVQLRADCFNLTNTPHFDPPNVSLGNPLFGVVSTQGNQPRIVQFALKLKY